MWLHTDLRRAADWHFKEHQKLILEAGQMLSTALNEYGLEDLSWYGSTHIGHPMSVWTRTSAANWFKMRDYMSALHESFYGHSYAELRWADGLDADLDAMDDDGEIHATMRKMVQSPNPDEAVRLAMPSIGLTARPRCFGHGFEDPDPTSTLEEAYREYYRFNASERSDKFTKRGEMQWL